MTVLSGSTVGLTASDLQSTLGWEVLPRLSLYDLVSLARTCTTLRDTVYGQDEAWRTSASAHLPARSSSYLHKQDRSGVQQAMQRRKIAVKNLKNGQSASRATVELGSAQPLRLLLSADGKFLACQTAAESHCERLSMYSTEGGGQVWSRLNTVLMQEVGLEAQNHNSIMRLSWLPGSNQITACQQAIQGGAAVTEFTIFSVDVQCGFATLCNTFKLDMSMVQPAHLDQPFIEGWITNLSPDASKLAIIMYGRGGSDSAIVAALSIVRTSNGDIVLSLPCCKTANFSMDWSNDSRWLFLSSGHLFDTCNLDIKNAGEAEAHRIKSAMAFDEVKLPARPQFDCRSQFLGAGFEGRRGSLRHPNAAVLELQTGDVKLLVPDSVFCGFLSMSDGALVSKGGHHHRRLIFSVWDFRRQHKLFQMDLQPALYRQVYPTFFLSDQFIYVSSGFWASVQDDIWALVLDPGDECRSCHWAWDECTVAVVQEDDNDSKHIVHIFSFA